MYCVHLYGLHGYCALVDLDSSGSPRVRPTLFIHDLLYSSLRKSTSGTHRPLRIAQRQECPAELKAFLKSKSILITVPHSFIACCCTQCALEFTCYFLRHSEVKWMLSTHLAYQRHRSGYEGLTLPSKVNFFIWLATQPILVGQLCLVGQLRLTMCSIGMRFRQLLLVGQLHLVGRFLGFGTHSFCMAHRDPALLCPVARSGHGN